MYPVSNSDFRDAGDSVAAAVAWVGRQIRRFPFTAAACCGLGAWLLFSFLANLVVWTKGSHLARMLFGFYCLPYRSIGQYIAYQTGVFNLVAQFEQRHGLIDAFYVPIGAFALVATHLIWAIAGLAIGLAYDLRHRWKGFALPLATIAAILGIDIFLAALQFHGIPEMSAFFSHPDSVSAFRMERQLHGHVSMSVIVGPEKPLSRSDILEIRDLLQQRVRLDPVLNITAPQSLCIFSPDMELQFRMGARTMRVQIEAGHGSVSVQTDRARVFLDCELQNRDQLKRFEERVL